MPHFLLHNLKRLAAGSAGGVSLFFRHQPKTHSDVSRQMKKSLSVPPFGSGFGFGYGFWSTRLVVVWVYMERCHGPEADLTGAFPVCCSFRFVCWCGN